MKKLLFVLIAIGLVSLPPVALAGLSESCAPAITCPSGQDYYSNACRSHIETLATCGTAPGGQAYNFSCGSGCFLYTPAACPSGRINVAASGPAVCRPVVNAIKNEVTDTLLKIWDGTTLKRLVYVDDSNCTAGQVIEWNGTGWACEDQVSSQWTTNGSTISYMGSVGVGITAPGTNRLNINNGNVLIQNSEVGIGAPAAVGNRLHVTGATRLQGDVTMTAAVNLPANSIDSTELSTIGFADFGMTCANGQVIKSSGGTSWACGTDGSQWTTTGTNLDYSSGNVRIGPISDSNGTYAGTDRLFVNGNTRLTGPVEISAMDNVARDNQLIVNGGASITGELTGASIRSLGDLTVLGANVYLPSGSINGTEIANNTITGGAAAGTGDVAQGTITGWNVLDATLTAADIATGAIASLEILDGTITSADLSSSAGITSAQIANGTISSDDIGSGEVDSSEIAADAVGNSELADNAVTSANIDNQTITSADIGEDQVKTSELAIYFADLDLSPITTVLPGDYNTASSYCNGSDVAISGECEAFTTADASSRSNAIYITGFYRTNDIVGDATVYNRTWNCRGYNSVASNRYLRARAICLESN